MIKLILNYFWNMGQNTIMMFAMELNDPSHRILRGYTFL